MRDYVVRRLLAMVPSLFVVSLIIFSVLRIVPGDIARVRLSGGDPSVAVDPEDLAELRANLGLDQPLYMQYLDWTTGMLTGDMGESLWTGRPVTEHLERWFPVTLEIAVLALLVGAVFGISLGALSALNRGRKIDYVARFASILFVAAPSFWIGTLLLLALSYWLNWIPPVRYVSIFDDPVTNLSIVVWPSMIAGLSAMAYIARLTRSTILEIVRQDFVRTAHSKGLSRGRILFGHIIPNAIPPVITLLGLQFANLITGVAIVEIIFSVPGMGRGLIDGITQRDYILVQGLISAFAAMVLVLNLLVDLIAARADPRVTLS